MIKNENSGLLIVFDGIDGAGKTTQVNLLSELLTEAGETVIVSKEPTDGQWGAKLPSQRGYRQRKRLKRL